MTREPGNTTTEAAPRLSADAEFGYGSFREEVRARFEELLADADRLSERYRSATPFPFIVIDDFLPIRAAETVFRSFPAGDSTAWTRLPTQDQRGKLVTTDEATIPAPARVLIQELNSGGFVRLLERLTGIPELVVDAKLVGGGLHRIEPGGKLGVHVDFSHHPTNGLNRRLNLLLYLNKEWKEEYGGHLEFWSSDVKKCEQRILPIFNRCAIFSTTPISFHGHPEPLRCPPGEARKSLALYYFTKGRPGEEDIEHNTLFRSRPGDRFSLSNFIVRSASSGFVQDIMPPVIYRAMKRFWNERFSGVKH